MAIDTAKKRRQAYVASLGNLPWMRFIPLPIPDGAVEKIDRAYVSGYYYEGFTREELVVISAAFTATPESGSASLRVQFTDASFVYDRIVESGSQPDKIIESGSQPDRVVEQGY